MKKIRLSHYTIESAKIPANFDGAKLLMLSDLHDNQYGVDLDALMKRIDKEGPDYVFFAGDLVTRYTTSDSSMVLEFMAKLSAKYPVYFSNGNHETRINLERASFGNRYDKLMESLEKSGVIVLNNENCCINRGGEEINIYGLELGRDYYRKFYDRKRQRADESIVRELLGTARKGYNILLAHNPKYFESYFKWGADLVFSGHLHGGIIRLPLVGGLVSTDYTPFPKYSKGVFTKDNCNMVVSCGLGAHTIKVRLNNPPEIVSILLKKP